VKTLLLARHAKSSWNTEAATDFERPLNNRGLRDAPMMAERLADRALKLDTIVSSKANRALATARLLAEGLDHRQAVVETGDIYEAPATRILQTISGFDDSWQCVMMVGHNPGMSNTCNLLCQEAHIAMPTCAIACLELDIERWSDHYADCATLKWYDYPKKA
jgi:phosphohistidine phosphatase